jgi:2-oxoisovalerate dehydrogenase E2 component (dihydrolipoyl transacylase)
MENRIDLSLVKGSGKDGRIMKEDVVEFLEQLSSPSSSQLPPLPEKYQHELKAAHLQSKQTVAQIQKDPRRDTLSSKPKADKRVLLTQVQRVMFKAMTESLKIPHLALSDDIEVSSLVAMKKKLFPVILKETGVYLTFLPFFMKAASLALEDFPILNSAMDDKDNNFLIHKSSHNIGFALDSPSGLLVPNVKQVQSKSILQISQEIRRIQEESRSKGVQASDLTEGTFTLSNIGSIGGVFGVPVILPPQVCIAAIGGVRVIPAFDQQGNVVKSHSLTMVWSADHRVIDGATVTRFNNRFKSFIQEPSLMLLHLK